MNEEEALALIDSLTGEELLTLYGLLLDLQQNPARAEHPPEKAPQEDP